ncbi:Ig-like domain-containing protein [Archangium sp. Cb G35]|uniref:Ig-like domain-containing protein n=1 Tax=Archangium sp. Cb G35 TaxID=1920190 RepID=UPI0013012331|nr:Ig-like domain-containing protein [Archangium sp. Cb G35]
MAVGQPREFQQARGLQAPSPVRLPEPPARAPAVRAWRETPSEDNALRLAEAYFPEFSEGLDAEARQVPVPSAAALRVKLADREDGELELATRGYVFRVKPQGDSAATASRRARGATFYGPDHFWKMVGEQRVEEFVVMRAGASAYRASFEVEVPEGIPTVRDAGEYLEFLDGHEVPVVRMHYPVARDEAGRGRQGKVRLWGATPQGSGGPGNPPRLTLASRTLKVALELGLEGLEGTVVVDPGWSSTGSMATSRYRHTVQLLLNGKLLAAGGLDSGGYPLSSAELHDPETGTWSATSALPRARSDHTATPLRNGKVLVAGGYPAYPGPSLDNAELYDPATDTWSPTATLGIRRYSHTATLLPDGKVLVVGGNSDFAGPTVASAELYDPATGTWSPTGSLSAGRYGHTATLLPNGKVLVAGGLPRGASTDRAELYDPATGTFSTAGYLITRRSGHTATLLPTGRVLIAGGHNGSSTLMNAELYNPAAGTFSTAGSMFASRQHHAATLLPDGKVLVVSGYSEGWRVNDSALYNPATGMWSSTNALPSPRYGHAATLLPDGEVLVSGGSGSTIANPERYSAVTGSWRATGPLAATRQNHTTTLLPSGKVLVAGGRNASGPLSSVELYDPVAGTWRTTGALATARSHHTATLLPSGKVLVAGGEGTSGLLTSAELYDPATGTWSTTGSLATARGAHVATLLPSGKLLVTGGDGATGVLRGAELYAPAAGTWSTTGSLARGRARHTATLLPSGEVLVAGGMGSSSLPLGSAELYEPVSGTFRGTGIPAAERTDHTATLLASGRVLLTGGSSTSGPLASAELYDPEKGSFSATGSLALARTRHVAIPLSTGQVLVAAGQGTSGRLASVEVYEPSAGTFSTVGPLAAARMDASVVPLPGGKVLMTGGASATGALASAEVYEEWGAPDAWRPVVTTPPSSLLTGSLFTVSGSGFLGISEASGGNTMSSAANLPFVSFTALEGGMRTRAMVLGYSNTSVEVKVPPALVDGYYLLRVTTQALSGGAVVFVDGPPPTPVLTAPAAFVNTPTPTLAGTAEPGSTVTVSLEGMPVGTVTADALGVWSLVVGTPLSEGPYTATAIAVDGTGNASPVSAPRSFTVDTTAPEAPVLTAPAALVTSTRPTIAGTAEPYGRVTVRLNGSAVLGTVTADASGNWSLIPPVILSQDTHTTTATVTDRAGNTSVSSPVRSFTVDSLAPATPSIGTPGTHAGTTTPTYSGSAEAHTTVTVTVDDKPVGTTPANASGNWSFTQASPLSQGVHEVRATATDAAGNTSDATFRTFIVDTVAPAAPVFTAPAAFVNTTTPTLSGTAEAGSTVAVRLNGGTPANVTTDASGNWSFTPASPLDQGAHTATATATDAAGNTSGSASRSFTVDSVAPEAPVLSDPGTFVNTATPTLSGFAEAGSTVTVKVDGSPVGTVTANGSGTWNLTLTSPLGEGAHTAIATATDATGNTSGSSTARTFTVDTTAPTAPVLTAPAAVVTTTRPLISGTAEPGSTVAVMVGGSPVGTAMADASGAWSLTLTSPLGEGAHTATATATDAAGNTSGPSTARTFTVDSEAPAAPVLSAPATLVTTPTPVISGTAEPGNTVTLEVDGTPSGTVTADASGNWSFTPASPLLEGTHSATATATDRAGNTSASSPARTFTVDTVAPAAPVLTAPAALVTTSTPAISGTAEAGDMVEVRVDGVPVGTVPVHDSGTWTLIATLGEGAHTVTATVTDRAGNTSGPSSARTFTVDTRAPLPPEVVTPAEGSAVTPGEQVFSGTAEPGSTVMVSVDGLHAGTAIADPSGQWSVNPDYALAQGRHTVTATATDAAGHTSPASSPRAFTVDLEVETQGCGCASSPAGGMAPPLGLLALWFWSRRRRLSWL